MQLVTLDLEPRRRLGDDGSVRYRDADIERVGKVIYGPTRRVVQQKVRDLQQALDRGLRVDQDRQTVGQFLSTWLEEVVRPNLQPKTARTYETVVRVH